MGRGRDGRRQEWEIKSHTLLASAGMSLKFELTNQDSAGRKNFTVLTSMKVNRNSIEIRQLFSLEIAQYISQKGTN